MVRPVILRGMFGTVHSASLAGHCLPGALSAVSVWLSGARS